MNVCLGYENMEDFVSQPEFIGSLEINKKCGGGRIFFFYYKRHWNKNRKQHP